MSCSTILSEYIPYEMEIFPSCIHSLLFWCHHVTICMIVIPVHTQCDDIRLESASQSWFTEMFLFFFILPNYKETIIITSFGIWYIVSAMTMLMFCKKEKNVWHIWLVNIMKFSLDKPIMQRLWKCCISNLRMILFFLTLSMIGSIYYKHPFWPIIR